MADYLAALAAEAKAPQPDQWSFKLVPPGRNKISVIIVGAGGVGARVIPALSQMLRTGDCLKIVDHDIVEQRNLHRQNFIHRDIGQPKASVLARRYAKDGIGTQAFVTKLTDGAAQISSLHASGDGVTVPPGGWTSSIIVGAVDNPEARQSLWMGYERLSQTIPTAYIDVGNEMRGGQVLLSFKWPGKATNLASGVAIGPASMVLNSTTVIPDLWRPAKADIAASAALKVTEEAPACADRLDLQTVVVNNMGASLVLNAINMLMSGLPIMSAGAFFSTLNTVSPIEIVKVGSSESAIWQGKPINS